MDLKEKKVTELLKEIEELKEVNEGIKEYNFMYLKEIASLRKEAKRVTEQANLLRHYRKETEQIKEAYKDRESDINFYLNALREIDTHIRSAKNPTYHIIDTLKGCLPEYQNEFD